MDDLGYYIWIISPKNAAKFLKYSVIKYINIKIIILVKKFIHIYK